MITGSETENRNIAGEGLDASPSRTSPRSTTGKKETLQKLAEIDDFLSKGIAQISMEDVGKGSSVQEVNPVSMIAKELNKLSTEERDEALNDLHGVASIIDEKPAFVQEKLILLQTEIDSFRGNKEAYEQTLKVSQEFVRDRHFRLMFLRSERFEPKDAAIRLINFFEWKQKLFGRERLAKKITLDDLDEDTLACLNTGYMQLLPGRDRAGRAVMVFLSKFRKCRTEINIMQAFWYVVMAALEDEETQRRGVVLVPYIIGISYFYHQSAMSAYAYLLRVLPLRCVGVHICVDDSKLQVMVAFTSLFMGSFVRHRCRCHTGTDLECQYGLMTFGIPNRILPISPAGELDKTMILNWLDTRWKLEKQRTLLLEEQRKPPSNTSAATTSNNIRKNSGVVTIMVPGPKDILLGRGKFIQENPGNLRYRKIIEKEWEHYESAAKANKTNIALELVKMLNDQGWRFLKKSDEGYWVEVLVEVAREKVSHWFRNRRGLLNGTKKKRRSKTGAVGVEEQPSSKIRSALARDDEELDSTKRARLTLESPRRTDSAFGQLPFLP